VILSDEELVVYELAFHLKMPVYKLVDEMPYEELLGWMAYFEKRPVDWRDDDRTFKFLQTQGVKAKPYEIFPSLKSIYNPTAKSVVSEKGVINPTQFKGTSIFNKLLSARGGDKLEFMKEDPNEIPSDP